MLLEANSSLIFIKCSFLAFAAFAAFVIFATFCYFATFAFLLLFVYCYPSYIDIVYSPKRREKYITNYESSIRIKLIKQKKSFWRKKFKKLSYKEVFGSTNLIPWQRVFIALYLRHFHSVIEVKYVNRQEFFIQVCSLQLSYYKSCSMMYTVVSYLNVLWNLI